MKVLVDTNVILDVLLERQPHCIAAAELWSLLERGFAVGFVAAHAITTVHYLTRKQGDSRRANALIRDLRSVFRVATVDEAALDLALTLERADFEDAVTEAAGLQVGCSLLATRDPKGFRNSRIRVVSPETAVQVIRRSR
ncbi:MAG: PIN domain-containing protein [Acidobacteria bacterium]|nr:PIN domain-containing protein [Acidobacteriota bacterium]